jgi:hypothetical protein
LLVPPPHRAKATPERIGSVDPAAPRGVVRAREKGSREMPKHVELSEDDVLRTALAIALREKAQNEPPGLLKDRLLAMARLIEAEFPPRRFQH